MLPFLVLLTVSGILGQENSLGSHAQRHTANRNEFSPLLHVCSTDSIHFPWKNCLVSEKKEGFILYEVLIRSEVKGANGDNVRLCLGLYRLFLELTSVAQHAYLHGTEHTATLFFKSL